MLLCEHISHFSHSVTKSLTSILRGGRVDCGSQLKGIQSIMEGKVQQQENEADAHLASAVGREQEVEPGYKTSKLHFPHQCPTSGRFNNLPKQHYPAEDQVFKHRSLWGQLTLKPLQYRVGFRVCGLLWFTAIW